MQKNIIKRKMKSNKILYPLYRVIYNPIRKLKQIKLAKKWYLEFDKNYNSISLETKKIIYIGIPLHPNLGDQAQYYCTLKWLKNNYNRYKILEIPDCLILTNYKKTINKLKRIVNENDIFIFQSGYRTTDIGNSGGNIVHCKIVSKFKSNKVLVLPQTVNFNNKFELEKTSKSYAKNKNVLFLARDKHSYRIAHQYLNKVLLYPDIVTSLIGKFNFQTKREGILFCLRNDEEKLYNDSELNQLINSLRKYTNVTRTDTTINITYDELKNNLEKNIIDKIEEFAKHKIIITDRYHGTIFGLISNTPTIVINSSDHKVSSGIEWFKEKKEFKDFVFYAESLEKVEKIVLEINETFDYTKKLPDTFDDDYYSKLKEIFEKE